MSDSSARKRSRPRPRKRTLKLTSMSRISPPRASAAPFLSTEFFHVNLTTMPGIWLPHKAAPSISE